MSIIADYHLHSDHSGDSSAAMEVQILSGIERGLRYMCFTEHYDPEFPYENNPEVVPGSFELDYSLYRKEFMKMKERFEGEIELGFGVELGLQPHLGSFLESYVREHDFDFIIGSNHLCAGYDPYYPDFLYSRTQEEAMELFRLPRHLGTYEGDEVVIGTGRYGNYVSFQKKFISLDPDADPLTIELDDAIKVIEERRKAEADRFIKRFDEEPDLEIIRGRFGPYLTYKEQNYRLPKAMQERAADLTLAECLGLIKDLEEKAKNAAPGSRRYARKNKQG